MRHYRVPLLLLLVLGTPAIAEPPSGEKAIVRDRPADSQFEAGKKWAVLIGVNDYGDPGITDLRYCVGDAKRVASTLVEHCGYAANNILTFTDDQAGVHLRPNKFLPGGLVEFLAGPRLGDTVLIFFAGHGFLDEEGRSFLALQDTELDNFAKTSLPAQDLRDILRGCRASQKFLVLDCCHAASERGENSPGPSSEEIGRAFDNAEGLVTLASCGKEEVSLEWPAKEQGLFTHYFDQGLRGVADANHDGYVTSDELYNYTFPEVKMAAFREFGRTQLPRRIIGPEVIGTFALAHYRVVPRTSESPSGALRVTAQFTVREDNADGPLAKGALINLLCYAPGEQRSTLLGSGVTDANGRASVDVTLSPDQQLQGSYVAVVCSEGACIPRSLDGFPESRVWSLYAPGPRIHEWTVERPQWTVIRPQTITNSIGMKMVLIPAGEFMMGGSESAEALAREFDTKAEYFEDEYPQHRVKLTKPFYLGVTEVTQQQYEQVMGENPSKFKDDP